MIISYTGKMAKRTTGRNRSLRPGPAGTPRKAPPASPRPTEPASRRRKPAVAASRVISAWTAGEIEEAFRRFKAANPAPKGELRHVDPFTLLVAVVLSAQATDAGVNKATEKLFAVAGTPAAMVELGEERLAGYIRTIGLYRTKARNVIALSQRLIAEHGGKVPHQRTALEALPGVGRKTANVVLNVAFGEPTIAVDTHVFRVGNRAGLAPGATPSEVEMKLDRIVPDPYKHDAHHWLILHGRYTCKAIRPACDRCLIADLCKWSEKAAYGARAT